LRRPLGEPARLPPASSQLRVCAAAELDTVAVELDDLGMVNDGTLSLLAGVPVLTQTRHWC
jgi:hypothetical protein